MAIVTHIDRIKTEEMNADVVKETDIQWLVTRETGAPNFAMRRFVVKSDGIIGLHEHDWEHEVYVLSGEGLVLSEQGDQPIRPGSVIFIPPGERHGFKPTGGEDLVFLCMIPHGPGSR